MTDEGFPQDRIDTTRPHPARIYDYLLGGEDNYEVDREAAERLAQLPDALASIRENRDFLRRATRRVVRRGVRQIIDIGTGIPTSPNTHEVARAIAPDVRVAYVDNDPIVGAYAGATLTRAGDTGFVLADIREPRAILEHPVVDRLIDFREPVALLLVAVLHFLDDADDPAGVVADLVRPLPPGSCLVISHGTGDFHEPEVLRRGMEIYRRATAAFHPRGHDEVVAFFDGFDLLDPGVVQASRWEPETPGEPPEELRRVGLYAGVGVRG
ncbi:SAM-dependent methyltransferase [Streptomyces sp. B6B3]|uniref:SAM-dependent methyltransferase n=1 Tax=Streptomyces sp. B6B3 TaxID=3153570 RepID=UPI00325E3D9B